MVLPPLRGGSTPSKDQRDLNMPSQIMPTINLLKLPDPAARSAKFVNMMNATKQQEAAERQAMIAQEKLDLDKNRDVREADLQAATLTEKGLAAKESNMKRLRNLSVVVLNTKNPTAREAAYQNLLGLIDETDKPLGDMLRQVAPTYDGDLLEAAVSNIDDHFKYKYSTPIASGAVNNRTGQQTSVTLGGKYPRAEAVFEVEPEPTAAPAPRTPVVPTAAPQQTTPGPVPVGKYGETRVIPDSAVPLTDFEQEDIRRIKEGSGMTNTPASFTPGSMGAPTAGQMSPDMVPAIIDSAMKTGVMAQIDLDQMLAMTPPQARQGIVDVLRSNNVSLQADAPSLVTSGMNQQQPMAPNPVGRQQSQFADMRGPAPQASFADLGSAPPVQNTMLQSQGRTPFIPRRESPAPGIYGVPTQDVAATSRATRPSKQEMYDAEAAKIEAQRDAGPPPVTAQQKIARKSEVAQAYSKTQTLIDKAYNPKEGIISIANKIKSLSPDQKEAITGYSGYIPSFRESSREADTLFGNLKGVVTSLGKDAAAASGAVGNMAVQEWKIAADMIADLKLEGMTPAALDAQMDRIIEQVSNATKLAERVYGIQYGEDVKQYPAFKLRGSPPARPKTPVVKGGSRISPDIDKILKSRGI